jgi:hypothetical protein
VDAQLTDGTAQQPDDRSVISGAQCRVGPLDVVPQNVKRTGRDVRRVVRGRVQEAAGAYYAPRSEQAFRTLLLHWNGTRWSRVASPDTSSGLNILAGVTAASARNAWATGYFCVRHCQQDGEVDRTLILHWNGTRWSRATSPDPGHGGSVLAGIGAASPARAWAVGYTCAQACENTTVFHPLALRWNGTEWSHE